MRVWWRRNLLVEIPGASDSIISTRCFGIPQSSLCLRIFRWGRRHVRSPAPIPSSQRTRQTFNMRPPPSKNFTKIRFARIIIFPSRVANYLPSATRSTQLVPALPATDRGQFHRLMSVTDPKWTMVHLLSGKGFVGPGLS